MSFPVEQLPILIPAFLAGLAVLVTHVPLGREVLERGIIFMDLAVAQTAALGVLLAEWVETAVATHVHGVAPYLSHGFRQLTAAAAAVAGAAVLYAFRRHSTRVQEAVIGIAFVLAATGGMLVLAGSPRGGEQLKQVLAGQILWVRPVEIAAAAIVSILLLLAWLRFSRRNGGFAFYGIFAVAITLSTQLVGIYLVFATLIIPALATLYLRRPLTLGYIIGVVGYGLGLVLSALFDLPTGPLIVWTLALTGSTAWLIARARRTSVRESRSQS